MSNHTPPSTPGDIRTWSQFEAARASSAAGENRSQSSSASSSCSSDSSNAPQLPEAVRAIIEQCKAQQQHEQQQTATTNVGGEAGQALPYPCRIYESLPGEEDLLQLQWMRIDMSTMDSEECWGEPSGCQEDYDCGPDSGLLLPAVYSVDPGQLFPMTFVGLPPELMRVQRDDEGSRRALPQEIPEDRLCKLGADVTDVLSQALERQGEGLPDGLVHAVASLSQKDWDICLERHVDLRKCDPSSFVEFVSTCVPPTLDCLLGTVLPSLIAQISTWQQQHGAAAATESDAGARKRKDRSSEPQEARPPGSSRNDGRAVEAIQNLCRLGGAFAKAERQDPVRFRNKISASGLRNLGAVGREAEVVLAEAFFARSSGHL